MDKEFLAANDKHDHSAGNFNMTFIYIGKINEKGFNLTILSVSLGLNNGIQPGFVEQKGIVGNVSLNGVDIIHQKWLH